MVAGNPRDVSELVNLPGGVVVDGKRTTQEVDIGKMKKPGLQALCRGFGLASSGNKDVLKTALRKFSADQTHWSSIDPSPRRMHRGPKAGKISKTPKPTKQSARRAQEVFNSGPNEIVPHLPYSLPVEETPTSRSQSDAILERARRFVRENPYVNKAGREAAAAARAKRLQIERAQQMAYSTGFQLWPTNISYVNPISNHQASYATPLESPHVPITFAPSLSPHAAASPLPIPPQAPAPISSPLPLAPAPQLQANTCEKSKTRSLVLNGGRRVEFAANEVGPPPAISFAEDLAALDRMWDDTSDSWDGHSALIIKGIPIPIVYWKAVYARPKSGGSWKTGDWKRVKGSWGEWKSIVKRWRQSSEDDFWREFSDDAGRKLSYTMVVHRLKEFRINEDKKLADEARKRFGAEFSSIFTYRKSGVSYTKKKDHDVAEQYRKILAAENSLAGDESDMDIDSD